jgi:hypothetical protein
MGVIVRGRKLAAEIVCQIALLLQLASREGRKAESLTNDILGDAVETTTLAMSFTASLHQRWFNP